MKYLLYLLIYIVAFWLMYFGPFFESSKWIMNAYRQAGISWPEEFGRLFSSSVLSAIIANFCCLNVDYFGKRWHINLALDKRGRWQLFVRSLIYLALFLVGVGIFGANAKEYKSTTFLDYAYLAAVAAIFSGILNIWFDFIVACLKRNRSKI